MTEHPLAIVCDGVRLAGGICIPDDPKGACLLLHGIPSVAPPDPDDRGYPGTAERFADEGWAAAWVDMRAVRGSKGYFSIEGWVRDARTSIDAVRSADGVQGLPLALIGSSAGGAVATEVVARGAPVDALALLAAPAAWLSYATDPEKGVRRITEEAGMALSDETRADPGPWMAEFENVTTERSIVKVKIPTLIVHGTADDVVPVHHADRLRERAARAEVRIIEGAGHQLRKEEIVLETLLDWLDRTLVHG
jgi:alpha-beta hydrolase superfamily lysophospholipase